MSNLLTDEACHQTAQTPTFTVLGVCVNPVPLPQVLDRMEAWITANVAGRWIVATGMHGVMEARRDAAFRRLLGAVDLFLPDGYSLVWLARRRGFPLPSRVCGADLLEVFCARAAQRGYRVFFLGDTEEVLGRLRAALRNRYPDLQIVGTISPPFRALGPNEDAAMVQAINDARPDVLWVGLGLPKQEWWIAAHRSQLTAPVLVGVGAAFKFVSGAVRRAPDWIGQHGWEWLWRFVHEPKRLWRRALLDVPVFTAAVLWHEVRHSWSRHLLGGLRAGVKRGLDLTLASVGLVCSLPLWALIACCIKAEDDGPIFYRQQRVGQHGRRFWSVKFRTMVEHADIEFGIRQAREEDPRITRVGRWLRRTALDELPQLWNIARGDMSVVGPRALAPGEIEVNGNGVFVPLEAVPGFEQRQQVRPGLTGLAQVFAARDLPRQWKFRYDGLYIRRQGVWMDLWLIAMSFWITFRGRWESRSRKV